MSTITSDIPREIEDLLIDIKYIAGLPPGHKYDINSQSYASATSTISWVRRHFFTNEDKIGALNFINKTIYSAIVLARKYPKWQNVIIDEVSLLTDAITNLRHVYSGKPQYLGRLFTVEIKIQSEAFRNALVSPKPPGPPIVFVERDLSEEEPPSWMMNPEAGSKEE